MALSKAQQFATLPNDEQQMILAGMSDEELEALAFDFDFWGRPEQLPPDDESWDLYGFIGGRGSGKTRSASEWLTKKVNRYPGIRGALLGRTTGDVRDIMVEGASGMLAVARPDNPATYEPSKRRITYANGATLTTFTAEEPDQLRGPEFGCAWADEFAALKGTVGVDGLTAFDNLLFALRTTMCRPQAFLSTTPKRVPAMRDLEKRAKDGTGRVLIARGSTYDNRANLARSFIEQIESRYLGTTIGQQEIYGLMLDDVEGASFKSSHLEAHRILDPSTLPALTTPVIAVDPSVGDGSGDECGITAVAASLDDLPTVLPTSTGLSAVRNLKHVYVLDDFSMSGPPEAWAREVARVAELHGTKVVIVEGNQGFELLRSVLKNVDPTLRVTIVKARVNKVLRAEPASQLSEQGRLHLVGRFPEMEDQMTTYTGGKNEASPDRMDAVVYGIVHFLPKVVERQKQGGFPMGGRVQTGGL